MKKFIKLYCSFIILELQNFRGTLVLMSLESELLMETKFLKVKNLENLNNVYNRALALNNESKLSFGRRLRNQLISVIDDEKDRPVELKFVMCMCQMLSGETLFLANKSDMYKIFLNILICMNTPDFRHVILAFGLKCEFFKMENLIKTKYSEFYFENSEYFDAITQMLIL